MMMKIQIVSLQGRVWVNSKSKIEPFFYSVRCNYASCGMDCTNFQQGPGIEQDFISIDGGFYTRTTDPQG